VLPHIGLKGFSQHVDLRVAEHRVVISWHSVYLYLSSNFSPTERRVNRRLIIFMRSPEEDDSTIEASGCVILHGLMIGLEGL